MESRLSRAGGGWNSKRTCLERSTGQVWGLRGWTCRGLVPFIAAWTCPLLVGTLLSCCGAWSAQLMGNIGHGRVEQSWVKFSHYCAGQGLVRPLSV